MVEPMSRSRMENFTAMKRWPLSWYTKAGPLLVPMLAISFRATLLPRMVGTRSSPILASVSRYCLG